MGLNTFFTFSSGAHPHLRSKSPLGSCTKIKSKGKWMGGGTTSILCSFSTENFARLGNKIFAVGFSPVHQRWHWHLYPPSSHLTALSVTSSATLPEAPYSRILLLLLLLRASSAASDSGSPFSMQIPCPEQGSGRCWQGRRWDWQDTPPKPWGQEQRWESGVSWHLPPFWHGFRSHTVCRQWRPEEIVGIKINYLEKQLKFMHCIIPMKWPLQMHSGSLPRGSQRPPLKHRFSSQVFPRAREGMFDLGTLAIPVGVL